MATSDEFVIDRTLGEGAFGKVFLVTGSGDDKKYAMKVINLKTAPDEERELAVREANLLRDLNHNNVLRYTDSFESDGALCIVTEYCENGDLSEFLDKRNKQKIKLEEDRLTEWFRQIASALQYLHGKKIVHRDVKTPNVFLTQKWETKLGDMGLAKVLEKPSQKAVTFCGSPYYMSPEIFSCKPYDSKSDIWALGVIVFEMATLERPFDATLMHQLVFKIVHGELPEMPKGYRPELAALLADVMQKDPEKRPTADAVLRHAFFKGNKAPTVPPKPVEGKGNVKSRYNINRPINNGQGRHAAGPFDMRGLLDTPSRVRQEQTKLTSDDVENEAKTTVKGLKTIIAKKPGKQEDAKVSPGKNKYTKNFSITARKKEPEGAEASVASLSDVMFVERTENAEDFDKTLVDIQQKTATEAFNVMQLIVRTMTGIFPDDKNRKEEAMSRSHDPQAVMLRQIEHLQYYCIRVLNDDVALFQTAYDLLANEKDEHKLEEQLIQVLGPEKFGLCGVQLMFLKNFEYNLSKMQK